MPSLSFAELDRLCGELMPERAVLGLATPLCGHGAMPALNCTAMNTGQNEGLLGGLLGSCPSTQLAVGCGSLAASK